MAGDPEDIPIGQYIHELEQAVDALKGRNADLLEVLREARTALVKLRGDVIAMVRDNAVLERDLYTAAWYGSVHNVGVRFPPDAEEAR